MKAARGYKNKCDKLVSQMIRSTGHCQRCGKTENLQCSHIISRRYSATRCDMDNVQVLCAGCHMYFTHWPKEFSRWITETVGIEKYEELKQKAETVTKVDWEQVYNELKERAKEYDL